MKRHDERQVSGRAHAEITPIINSELVFVEEAFRLILGRAFFSEGLNIGGNGLGSTVKTAYYDNRLIQPKTANSNSPWAYIRGRGLLIGRIFASEIWGAYFREGLFSKPGLLSEC